ncbi:MAG: CHRD domain-containing protein [Planctomycetes bacterium]|nr:CHRD domain-containing protein [Planctomycetota bacterium]
MKTTTPASVLLALGLSTVAIAQSTQIVYATLLDGAHAVPPNASPARGVARLMLDPATNQLAVRVTIDAPYTASAVFLALDSASSMLLQSTPDGWVGSATLTSIQRAALDRGESYVLARSPVWWNGTSIRGQVAPRFYGIAQRPLGNAVLQLAAGGGVTVAGIGSSGQDGVECSILGTMDERTLDLSIAGGWDAEWSPLDPNRTVPDGAYLDLTAIGTLGGTARGTIGSVRVTDVGADLEIHADFAGVGATWLEVTVYDGDRFLCRAMVPSGSSGWVAKAAQWPGDVHSQKEDECDNQHKNKHFLGLTWRGFRSSIALPNRPPVIGDLLLVRAADATIDSSIDTLQLRAKDIPQIAFRSQHLRALGAEVESLGDASLHVRDGHLVCNNLGGSGAAGARFHFASGDCARVDFAPLDPNAPVGASLTASFEGQLGPVQGADLGSTSVTQTANGLTASADFSAIGSTTVRVEVWSGNAMVASFPGQTGPLAGLPNWPRTGCWLFPPQCYYYPFPDGSLFTVAGNTIVGDSLRIYPENPAAVIGPYSSMSLELTGLPTLEVTNLAYGQALETALAPDDQGAVGGAVCFDVDVKLPTGVAINDIDLHLDSPAGSDGRIELWVRANDTSVGSGGTLSGWTLAAATSVTSRGRDRGTPATFGTPVVLPPGTHGIALRAVGLAHAYTIGTGSNEVFDSAALTLRAGYATDTFGQPGTVRSPRVFAGRIFFADAARAFASAVAFGTGCGPVLSATSPVLGSTLSLAVTDVPAGSQIGIVLLGLEQFPGIDLGPLGAPGCQLLVNPQFLTIDIAVSGSTAGLSIPIPNVPALVGASFAAQVLTVSPGQNAIGIAATNGERLVIARR